MTTVVIVALGSGGAAWALASSGPSGYRLGHVVTASVDNDLSLVGTVEPVSNASVAFQTSGKVLSISATVGEQVTAGQPLGSLDTTALAETVSSDQSALSADQAKLTEDEDAQTTTATSHAQTTSTTTPTHTSTLTTPTSGGTGSTADAATITQDQNVLAADEAITNVDQQQEAADLAHAETACGTAPGTTTTTTSPPDPQACTNALDQVSTDEQKVSTDQATVTHDEAALASALGEGSSSSSSPSGSGGSGGPSQTGTGGSGAPTGSGGGTAKANDLPAAAAASPTGNGSNASLASSNLGSSGAGGGGGGSSTPTDTPQQIADDQAAIDSAKADLIGAQQAMNSASLTSPINGTVVSVGVAVGDTVTAGSSTAVIEIVGTNAYEVVGDLSSSQVASVKVGQNVQVSPDSASDPLAGTVSQVGPVESTSSGYTYPVVVALPTSAHSLYAGSTANETIATGQVVNVVAVPTSAVITQGSRSYVLMLKDGSLTEKRVTTGMVGNVYTQIRSGLSAGQTVVLADLAEPVPSSNDASLGGGGFGGFGGFGGPGGFGGRGVINIGSAKGGASISFSPRGG